MAKDHVLPRYFLWLAVCVCGVLGGGVLRLGALAFWLCGLLCSCLPGIDGANRSRCASAVCLVRANRAILLCATLLAAAACCKAATPKHLTQGDVGLVRPGGDVRQIYWNEIGVRETTNNHGNRVGEYLRYCGLDEGYAWCAAFVSWCHGQAGYPEPRNAWSPAIFPQKRVIWTKGTAGTGAQEMPRAGDVFGIYYTNLHRIAHVGFVDRWDDTYCITVEGNTGPDGALDGRGDPANPIRAGPEGVYRKRRPVKTIYAVARWTD